MHHPREDGYFIIIVIIDQGDILSGGRLAVITNTDDINIHASQRIMHEKRYSCLTENVMHREKIFMPRINSCIVKNYVSRVNIHA